MEDNLINFIAKAATDSYFYNNIKENGNSLLKDRNLYVRQYYETFNIAIDEIRKMESRKNQEIGTEKLSEILK